MKATQYVLGLERLAVSDGQIGPEVRCGFCKDELNGGLVNCLNLHRFAADDPLAFYIFIVFRVQFDVVVPEGDIGGGKGCAVGPLVALAEEDCQFGIIVIVLIPLCHCRHHGLEVVVEAEKVDMPGAENIRGAAFRRF